MRWQRTFASLALMLGQVAVAQTSTTATVDSRATTDQSHTPSPTLPTFEIDVVFPRSNTTYNFTDYIPIVFSFQNFSAAAALGPFRFNWYIMPYGTLDRPNPGGVLEDEWGMRLSSENVSQFENQDGSAYIFVNATNTTKLSWLDGEEKWNHQPHYHEVSLYALQWHVMWDAFIPMGAACNTSDVYQSMLFQVQPQFDESVRPNPGDLGNVTDECAQFGSLREIEEGMEDVCNSSRELPRMNANPCNVKLDAARRSSISSEAAMLAKPTATGSTSTQSSTNVAAASSIHMGPALAAFGVFGTLQLLPL